MSNNKRNNKQENNIVAMPKQFQVNIVFVILAVMFIYICYHVFSFFTTKKISVYEVTQGSISLNYEYNALAIRDEEIINANQNGDIIYLAENISKAGVKTKIYAIDTTGAIADNMTIDSLSDKHITSANLNQLQASVNTFVSKYNGNNYNEVYDFKTSLSTQIDQIISIAAIDMMADKIDAASQSGTFNYHYAVKPGLVVYNIDGYENINLENYSFDSFNSSNLSPTNLKLQKTVEKDSAAYKLICSDIWYLVMPIEDDLVESLKEDSYVEIQFMEDNNKTWTSFIIEERDGRKFLVCKLDDSLERYANERFIHVKVLKTNLSGLKIPNSSIVDKVFFTVPKEYFYSGDSGSDLGLIVEDNETKTTSFVKTTIYHENDLYYYIDNEVVNKGDIIVKANSSSRYVIGTETDSLKGVYNINKGYAVFKKIDRITDNNEYTIIKSGTKYGISMYDHIALQGNNIAENDIISIN